MKAPRRRRAHEDLVQRTAPSGMTLVELLAVVVLLGLLTATLGLGFANAFARGRRELAGVGTRIVGASVSMYRLECGAWPAGPGGLAALEHAPGRRAASYTLAPDQLVDPWGNPYELRVPAQDGSPFEVVSFGADGLPGGDGEDSDVSSLGSARGPALRKEGRP